MVRSFIESILNGSEMPNGFDARIEPIHGQILDIGYETIRDEFVEQVENVYTRPIQVLDQETEDGLRRTHLSGQGLEADLSYTSMEDYVTEGEADRFHLGKSPYTEQVSVSMSSESLDAVTAIEAFLKNNDSYEFSRSRTR